ncbi:MAG: MscL family protein, partial [Oscillospiraceae bacterium]
GGINFSDWKITLPNLFGAELEAPLTINYGTFLSAVINFIIMALILFLLVKGMNTLMGLGKKKKEEEKPAPPAPSKEEVLLTEIRDLLKENKKD